MSRFVICNWDRFPYGYTTKSASTFLSQMLVNGAFSRRVPVEFYCERDQAEAYAKVLGIPLEKIVITKNPPSLADAGLFEESGGRFRYRHMQSSNHPAHVAITAVVAIYSR